MTDEAPSGNALTNLGPEDKVTAVMVHTADRLAWGKLVHREMLMASRLLVGVTMPDYVSLYDAQVMPTFGGQLSKPTKYSELHFPVESVIGYHLMPPAEDPVNYDENEPNRINVQVTFMVGAFLFKSHLRISTASNIKISLDVSKSIFLSVYDNKIFHPGNPSLKPIETSMALVRRTAVQAAVDA